MGGVPVAPQGMGAAELIIYVSRYCTVCRYAYEVADLIRTSFPWVQVSLVDLETTETDVPEVVFATPTYLLNGRVWSLGNPSLEKVQTTFRR
jgi:hypothetical protein